LTAEVDVAYSERSRVVSFYDGLAERLTAALPGAQAGAASQIPLGGNFDMWGVHVEGQSSANPADNPDADFYAVTPGYRRAMGIPLVRGRDFDVRDGERAPNVVLVNERLARRYWPRGSPLGRRLKLGGPDGEWLTIVGVVGDVRHHGLHAAPAFQAYVPHAQTGHTSMTVVLRSAAPATEAARAVRAAVAALEPDAPVSAVRSGDELVAAAVAERRFVSRLLSAFALAATLLVAVGLVGALVQAVTQRTREIGVRLVLGAGRAQVTTLMLRHGLLPAVVGLGVGLALAPLAARLLLPLLFDVRPTDPATLAGAALGLAAAAALACVVPARRAARIDPAVVLRGE
jgi:predicted permease